MVLAAYLATVPADVIDPDEEVELSVPFEPPAARDVPADRPAAIDRLGYLDAFVEHLDRHDGPPEELIEELVSRPPAGLVSDAWLSVLCHEDGSATYYIPPTKAHHDVLNADLFCSAVESHLQRPR